MRIISSYNNGLLQLVFFQNTNPSNNAPKGIQFKIEFEKIHNLIKFLENMNARLAKSFEPFVSEYDDHYQDYLAMIEPFSISDREFILFVSKKHQSYLYVGEFGINIEIHSLNKLICSIKSLLLKENFD